MKNKHKRKVVFNPYATYTDEQLIESIESYLIYRKSCDVARMLVVECCHDSYEMVDTTEEECKFNSCLTIALERKIPVDLTNSDLRCNLRSVASILDHMCGLELSWLDENRHCISDNDFILEEENILLFYRGMIKELSEEQIFEIEKKLCGDYSLVL